MSDFQYVNMDDTNAKDILEPIPTSSRESYIWTDDNAFKLIHYRMQYKELFTRKKGSATLGYKKIAENLGLGEDYCYCVKKKWENMVDKFRQEIKKVIVDSEADNPPYLRSTWKYYDAMCDALGYEREVNRVKLTMKLTHSNCTSTSPQIEPITNERRKRPNNRIMQKTSVLPTPVDITFQQTQLQNSDSITYSPHEVDVKIEPNDFEFVAMFAQEELHDNTNIDNLIPKEEITIDSSDIMQMDSETFEGTLVERTPEVPTTEIATDVETITPVAAVASTSQVYPTGVVQSNHGAASDALSSCLSSDDTTDVPCNKKSSTSKRGKKRKHQDDEEDDDVDKIWKYIKEGDEEIRNDFKQLIEIQRKTSEHIEKLVHYLINKDKK